MTLPDLQITKDGSHTLISHDYVDTYHSRHGAIAEAQHVFIKNGLFNYRHYSKLNIFEMGFGTGLNTVLTYLNRSNCQEINYTAIDSFPLPLSLIKQLNYSDWIDADTLFAIHHHPWNIQLNLSDKFNLYKDHNLLIKHHPNNQYDLIYYDAFGPTYQPELWTIDIFKRLYKWLNSKGMVVTYCAKGSVKRDFSSLGFNVQTLQGPPGKREMIIAVKA